MRRAEDRVTRSQLYALREVDMRGHLQAGWGGYTRRTLRSLSRRGLLRTPLADDDRFILTEAGRAVLDAHEAAS